MGLLPKPGVSALLNVTGPNFGSLSPRPGGT
jgi:hypothetical protein